MVKRVAIATWQAALADQMKKVEKLTASMEVIKERIAEHKKMRNYKIYIVLDFTFIQVLMLYKQ